MLTGILLFVVLFYVYPLKFVFKLVIGPDDGVRLRTRCDGEPVHRSRRRRRG